MTAYPIARPVDSEGLVPAFRELLGAGFRPVLVSAQPHAESMRVGYVLLRPGDDARVELLLSADTGSDPRGRIPSLAHVSYPVGRFERELHDLYGIVPVDHPMPRRLVRHAHWPSGWYPMTAPDDSVPPFNGVGAPFPFSPIEGQGVYEIPVGPVHAGLIEPGHFRFSVVGETILRMKARLWFLHRGLERLLRGRTPEQGIELAERVSGDTAVGHTLAYCLAVEQALGIQVDRGAQLGRAVLLELERLYNHVGDLGALANDVGFGLAHAHALRLREELLRLNNRVTGHRLLRGGVLIGGARLEQLPDMPELDRIAVEVAELAALTTGKAMVLDRFAGTSRLARDAAAGLGTVGYVARASGIDEDARRDHPFVTLPPFEVVTEPDGDVLARYRVRAREFAVSRELLGELVAECPARIDTSAATTSDAPGNGLGIVEGWRGRIVHRVSVAPDGTLSQVKIVDPSFLNWPALSVALSDTIVPDFPLANKSFNQSYAGNDL